MATIEENVLIIHKDKEGNLHLQYPATKWGNVIDAPSKLPANGGTADYINVHSIAASTDLNSVTTPGIYYCAANATVSTLKNCPTTNAFYLCVGRHAGVYQEIVEYVTANPKKFMRNQYSSTWGSWYREFHTGNPPSKAEVGLGSVDNTSDLAKPISTAVQTALNGKEPVFTKNSAFNKNFGTGAGTVCQGNDARLSDARTPKAHTHTKSEVGLGSVPNVTTNDQTPTYTDTTTFATLSSGEKLSIAFAKIKLAITNLINHIANKSNPHGVTKAQVGLGNVDNTPDANKPLSAAMLGALDGKAASNHNHNGVYEPVFTKNNAFNKAFGTGAGTVCQGNDARLSDARTPKAHTHTKSQITDFPASLKNPTVLNLQKNGSTIVSYDGSAIKTFNLEISNANLLINGDFQVWQRGTTFSFTGNESFHYSADRWCVYASSGQTIKIDKVSGGIQVNGASTLMQRLEIPLETGKKYMLSAKVSGSIRSVEITGGTYMDNTYFKYNKSGTTEQIQVKISGVTIISYVLLSAGVEVPIFLQRPYAEELLLCQRYYAYLRDIYVGRYWANAYLGLYFPTEMRVNPTVVYQKVMSSTWADVSAQSTMNSRVDKRGYRSVTTTSEDGPLLTIQYLELDAEMY